MHIPLPSSTAAMTQPKITVCRKDVCYDWLPTPLSSTEAGGSTEVISNVADITATLWRNSDGSVTLDIEWRVDDESQLQNGDHYVVKLADGAGTPTTYLDMTASYQESTPSGPDCGPVCLQASLSP